MRFDRPWLIVGLMLLFAAVYFYQDPSWNGNSRLLLTRAIVERGTLRLDALEAEPDWHTEDMAVFKDHYYTDKGIGSSLLAAPFHFLIYKFASALGITLTSLFIKHSLTAIVMGFCFAVNGIVMFAIAGKLLASPARALLATLAVAMGTMLWPYSAIYYGLVPAGMFLILAFYALLSFRLSPGSSPARFLSCESARFCLAGLAMGLAFITDYTSSLIILGLLIYAAYVLMARPFKRVLSLAIIGSAGALIPVLILFLYNSAVYGNPLAIGYTYEVSDTFRTQMSSGLMGIHRPDLGVLYHITLDPRSGLLLQSPILLLAPVGYYVAVKSNRFRAETLLSLYAVAVMLLMNSGYYAWWGGNALGPRFLIPSFPFFIVALALLPASLDLPMLALSLVSISQMLIPLLGQVQMSIDFRLNSFFIGGSPFRGFSILYQVGIPMIFERLKRGEPSWNLGLGLGLPFWLSPAPLFAVEAGLIYVLLRRIRACAASPSMPTASPLPGNT